jgi:hypothetical protein
MYNNRIIKLGLRTYAYGHDVRVLGGGKGQGVHEVEYALVPHNSADTDGYDLVVSKTPGRPDAMPQVFTG